MFEKELGKIERRVLVIWKGIGGLVGNYSNPILKALISIKEF